MSVKWTIRLAARKISPGLLIQSGGRRSCTITQSLHTIWRDRMLETVGCLPPEDTLVRYAKTQGIHIDVMHFPDHVMATSTVLGADGNLQAGHVFICTDHLEAIAVVLLRNLNREPITV